MTIKKLADQIEVFAVTGVLKDLTFKREVLPGIWTDGKVNERLTQQFLSNPRFAIFAAFNEIGAAMGYICGEIREDIYTGELSAFELLWVVGNPFRKSGAGLALLNAWEAYAKEMGAVRSYMGLNEHTDSEILRAIYPKLGYRPHSASYQKPL